MYIKEVDLIQFRNIDKMHLKFNNEINIFIGKNGQGKTNIIESFYYLSLCRSFRSRHINQVIKFNQEFSKIHSLIYANKRDVDLEIILTNKSKKARVNRNDVSKVSDFVGYLNVVVFTPDDLSLVKDGPNVRRKLLNEELSKVSPIYLYSLNKYNQLLKERNAFLKVMKEKNMKQDLFLDTLNEQIVNSSIVIMQKRDKFIKELSLLANDIYQKIAKNDEYIEFKYKTFTKTYDSKEILAMYDKKLAHDLFTCTTNIGIHKDDVLILLNGKDASYYASQGQQRTIVLSMKIALVELIKKEIGEYPVLLLDDVLSELDDHRKLTLLSLLDHQIQTFITTTSIQDIDFNKINTAKIFEIENGKVKEEYVYG